MRRALVFGCCGFGTVDGFGVYCSTCVDCGSWFLTFCGCCRLVQYRFWVLVLGSFDGCVWVFSGFGTAFSWFLLVLLVVPIWLHSVDFLVGVLVLGGVGVCFGVVVSWFCLFWVLLVVFRLVVLGGLVIAVACSI